MRSPPEFLLPCYDFFWSVIWNETLKANRNVGPFFFFSAPDVSTKRVFFSFRIVSNLNTMWTLKLLVHAGGYFGVAQLRHEQQDL